MTAPITMTYYTATIIRPMNQPIGIGLTNDPINGLIISSIDAEGALGESSLRKGMKLRTINNVDVSGLSSKEAVKILKQTEGELIILAEKVVPSQITFELNHMVHGRMTDDINNAMPTSFSEAGVPSNTFTRIYKLVEKDLLPAAAALRGHEVDLDREFGSYVSKQMVKGGMIGFGTESSHEKRMFEAILKSSHLERNVDLKAMQVTMQANAMVAKYNLMATVALESVPNGKTSRDGRKKYERLNVVGLKFHQIE